MEYQSSQEKGNSPPPVRTPNFKPLTPEEAAQIRGGRETPTRWKAGTCPIVGYACLCSGGLHLGICAIAGYTTGPQRGA